jgi:hypothetical protein
LSHIVKFIDDQESGIVPKTLAERVTDLEKTTEPLRELPARVTRLEFRVTAVEEQVVQLRGEMRDGFSAVLEVIEAGSAATQRLFDETRTEMSAMRTEMATVRTQMGAFGTEIAALRSETNMGLADVRTEMRVLHENLVERIARIGEGRRRTKRQRGPGN